MQALLLPAFHIMDNAYISEPGNETKANQTSYAIFGYVEAWIHIPQPSCIIKLIMTISLQVNI